MKKEQIQEEIRKLRAMKPNVRKTTSFGDDNHAAIDAQIRVLEKDMDESEIDDMWEDQEYLRDNAMAALEWVEGSEKVSPSKNWQPLAQ